MPTLNPWTILVGLLLVATLCAASLYEGYKLGESAQKIADQKLFDKINSELSAQKTEAEARYRAAVSEVFNVIAERDKFKFKLEKEHVKNQDTTNKLRDSLAAYGLRFRAETARCGDSAGCADSPEGDTTSYTKTTYCKVSGEVEEALKFIAYDADTLLDDYTLLYEWANGESK